LCYLGGQHIAAYQDPDVILPQVKGLISDKVCDDLECIMHYGAPAQYNKHGSFEQFLEYQDYGNHKSIVQKPAAFCKAMNKEDKCDYVLTFPSYIKDFIPDLWLTPNGLVQIPGKKDRVIFDVSFLIHALSHSYNSCVSNKFEPKIIFSGAWNQYLQRIYNLHISFPDEEILTFDDNVVSAFRQIKYHPNILSSKGFCYNQYLFAATGLTFGDMTSPPSFEPFAAAPMALATELNQKDKNAIPTYDNYLNAVKFAPPQSDGIHFVPARLNISTEESLMTDNFRMNTGMVDTAPLIICLL
jgi:hypothetical protein